MTAGSSRPGMTWSARFAWALILLLAGAAFATWGLSRWEVGARFFGIAPASPVQVVRQAPQPPPPSAQVAPMESLGAADAARIATVESRLAAIEGQAQAAA